MVAKLSSRGGIVKCGAGVYRATLPNSSSFFLRLPEALRATSIFCRAFLLRRMYRGRLQFFQRRNHSLQPLFVASQFLNGLSQIHVKASFIFLL